MEYYDPLLAPDPEEWKALDETERQILVEEYHRRARIRLPNSTIHAILHVIVENQITEGDELPVKATLERLMKEGLDRHEAIHAIGTVLSGFMFDAMNTPSKVKGDPNKIYFDGLAKLTAQSWRDSAEGDDSPVQ